MALIRRSPFLLAFLVLVPGALERGTAAEDPPPDRPEPSRINATQLTLRLGPVQGRATVIARWDRGLIVLTAAHFLSGDDVGKRVVIGHEGWLQGRLEAVAQNPSFHPLRSRTTDEPVAEGTLGIDTSIARIRVDPRNDDERRMLERIRTAELTTGPIPAGSRQIVTVHIVDQAGQEHVLRAGNHLNPRCLAWGRGSYDTRPGDSGAGVFVVRQAADGRPSPLLIGNVSQTDERGGIASLAWRNERWIDRAINGSGPVQPPN